MQKIKANRLNIVFRSDIMYASAERAKRIKHIVLYVLRDSCVSVESINKDIKTFILKRRGKSMIEYKKLQRYDYPVFRELMTAYYRDGEDAETEQSVLDSFIADLFSMVTEDKIQGCFMFSDETLLGFVLYMIDTPGCAFSEIPNYGTFLEIGIVPSMRGKGYGAQAVADIERQMRQEGAEHFYVTAYPLAAGFWTKRGYTKTEDVASNGLFIYKK